MASDKTMNVFIGGLFSPELSGPISEENIEEMQGREQFVKWATCARCGRRLTDPKSIANGMGPDCMEKEQAEKPTRERKALEAAGQFTLSYFTAPELCGSCKWLKGPKCGRGMTFPGQRGTCKRYQRGE